MPGVVREQVSDVISVVSRTGVCTAQLYDIRVQLVSEAFRPVPTNVTVDSSVALVGLKTSVDKEEWTVKTDCAKSPTLGAQPSLPAQAVTSITYSPGGRFPIMKLPVTFAKPKKAPELGMNVEHAAPVRAVPDVGLDRVHEVVVPTK